MEMMEMVPHRPYGNAISGLTPQKVFKSDLTWGQVIYHVTHVSSRDRALHRYVYVTPLEYKCGRDRIHGARRINHLHFAVSIGSPRLDCDRCRRSRSHHQYPDHLRALYDVCHLSIQLPQHLVLLGVPGRGLQGPQ